VSIGPRAAAAIRLLLFTGVPSAGNFAPPSGVCGLRARPAVPPGEPDPMAIVLNALALTVLKELDRI
jgi:hypothetical protein